MKNKLTIILEILGIIFAGLIINHLYYTMFGGAYVALVTFIVLIAPIACIIAGLCIWLFKKH